MRGEKVERRGGEERDRDRVILKIENHIYFGIKFEFLNYIYFGTEGVIWKQEELNLEKKNLQSINKCII